VTDSNDFDPVAHAAAGSAAAGDYAALSQRLGRIYQTLSRTNRAIARAESEAALLEELCRIAVASGGFALAWVGLLGPDGHVRANAAAGPARGYADDIDVTIDERDRLGGGPTARVLRSGEVVICNDFLTDPRTVPWRASAREHGIRASAAMPIRDERRVVGVLSVYSATPGDFGAHEVALLEDLAADVSLGLTRLRATAELKRAAEQRERIAAQLTRIEQAVRAGVFRLALPERTVSWSAGVAALLGLDPSREAAWPDLEGALSPAGAEALCAAILEAGRGDGALDLDLPLGAGASGPQSWLRVSARVQRVGAERLEAQGTLQDVTSRKEVEERKALSEAQSRQAQKMQALGVLAGGLAGEFSTAFAAIDGHINLARRDARRNAKVLKSLAVCSRACRNAADFARQILAFSRGQSSGPRAVAVPRVVEDAAALLRASLPPGDDVEFRSAGDVPIVQVDEVLLQQAVVALGIRCGQALAGRAVTIRIAVDAVCATGAAGNGTTTVRAGRYARIVVAASAAVAPGGATDAPADRSGPALDPAASDAGLEIAREIVVAQGGVLLGESGAGAALSVYLPAASAQQLEAPGDVGRTRNKTERRVQPAGAGQRILVVDDHKWLIALIERLLTERGYEPHGYTSADAALAALHADPDGYDAIVTDYKMPGSTGFDIIRAVKAVRPDLPVLLVSGYVSAKVAEQARRAGADAVLAKLSLATELLPALSQLLTRPSPPADPAA